MRTAAIFTVCYAVAFAACFALPLVVTLPWSASFLIGISLGIAAYTAAKAWSTS